MFLVWGTSSFRPTRDIDFLGYTSNDIQVVVRIFQELCDQEVEPDGLIFDSHTVRGEWIKEDAEYERFL